MAGLNAKEILEEEDRIFNEAHNIGEAEVIGDESDVDAVYDFLFAKKDAPKKSVNEEKVTTKKKSAESSTKTATQQGILTDVRILFKKHGIDPDNPVAKQVIGNLMFNLNTGGFLKK